MLIPAEERKALFVLFCIVRDYVIKNREILFYRYRYY